MATRVVEEPSTEHVVHEHYGDNAGSNTGLILGIILLVVVVFLFLFYGLPMIRGAASGPTVNVPKSVDVNVNGGTK